MTKWLLSFSAFLGLLALNVNAWGQSQTYSAGTTVYNFTTVGSSNLSGIPAGSTMTIECVGGGGGGGGAYTSSGGVADGGGGGGGAYATSNYTFTAGGTLTITVGKGGSAGNNSGGNGGNGDPSYVGTIVQANGGVGGTGSTSGTKSGGNGGTVGIGAGYSGGNGGNGATGTWDYGGGGGGAGNTGSAGSAGSSSNGNAGAKGTGSFVSGAGGAGGKQPTSPGTGGSPSPKAGSGGATYGGGGGGAAAYLWGGDSGPARAAGGAGAQGYVRITIVPPSCTVSVAPTGITSSAGNTICTGTSTTLTSTGGTNGTNAVDLWYTGSCTAGYINRWDAVPGSLVSTTASVANGILTATSSTVDPNIGMANLGTFAATTYKYINIRYKTTSATGVEIYYSKNAANSDLAEAQKVAGTYINDGAWHTLSLNMSSSANWTGTIYGWRFDWATTNGAVVDFDFIELSTDPMIGEGASITVSPTSTTTYYTKKIDNCGTSTTCASQTITVKTTSSAASSASVTANDNTCAGTSKTIAVSGGSLGTGASWKWYTSSCGGTLAGTGSSLSVDPSTTTTYYVRAEGDCNTTACVSVTVTVKTTSSAASSASVTANDNTCAGTSKTIAVSGGSLGTGASWKWYTSSCGGTLAGTGSSLSVDPSTTTTYYVRAEGDCNTTACVSVTVTVKTTSSAASSASVTANDNTCAGTSKTIAVSGGSLGTGASWKWYTSSCGGTLAGTGSSLSVDPSTTTTYYVRAEGDCNTTTCVSVTVDVSPAAPAIPGTITGTTAVCPNTTILTYAIATVTNATTYTWSVPTGWAITNGQGTTSITVTSGTAGQNGDISVTAGNTCGTSLAQTKAVTVSVLPTPTFASISPTAMVCIGTNVTYTTQSGKTNYVWTIPGTAGSDYTKVSGGTATDNSVTIAWNTITANTVVTVNYEENGCTAASPTSSPTVTLPIKGAALSDNESVTCYVNGSTPVQFYASSGNYIGSLNPNGRSGLVTMSTSVGSPAIQGACTMPSNPKYRTAYLGRIVHVDGSGLSGSGNVDVVLAYSDAELLALQVQAGNGSGGSTPGNVTDDITNLLNPSLGITKVGGDGSLCSGNSVSYLSAGGGVLSVTPSISAARYVSFAVPSFSSFYIHGVNGGSPLPITLTSFTASCEDKVSLMWKTATETNVSHYEILRSRDGQFWEEVATVPAVGNSTTEQVYHATDATGLETMYYKLRSVDNDGTSEDFQPVSVTCNPGALWSIHPVPVSVKATVTVTATETSHDVFVITDINGRVVTTQQVEIKAGTSIFELDLHRLSEGTYFIRMNQSDKYSPLKFIKVD